MRKITKVILVLIFLNISIMANTKNESTFIKEYTYNASDDDSKNSSRKKAITQLKALLSEEIGTHIRSDFQMIKKSNENRYSNEIKKNLKTISASFTKLTIIKEKWNGETYYIKASVLIDKKKTQEMIKKMMQNHKNLASNSQEIQEEIVVLSPDGYMKINNIKGVTDKFLKNYLKYILSHINSEYSSSWHLKFISENVALKNGSENYFTAYLKWKDVKRHPLSKQKLPKFWKKQFSFLDAINYKNREKMMLNIIKKEPLIVNNIDYGIKITVAVAIPEVKLPKSGNWSFFIINNKVYWSPF